MIRRLIPPKMKLKWRLLQRRLSDRRSGWRFSSMAPTGTFVSLSGLSVSQPIKRTALLENKVHNLRIAAARIEQVVVRPGEVFSFWKVVGNPAAANGYRTGRNILNGKLQEAIGGGLCQLSGIIYHTSILAGLEVVERYNHTVDIYSEEDRFTPLGADATVVYAYKDLRLRNDSDADLRFVCTVHGETITCRLESSGAIRPKNLSFDRTDTPESRTVITRDEHGKTIAHSHYRLPLP